MLLGRDSVIAAAGVTAVTAVALAPLRSRLQRRVDRRLYPMRRAALQAVEELRLRTYAGQSRPEELEDVLRGALRDPALRVGYLIPGAGGNNSSRWLLVPGWNTNIDYTAGDYGFAIPTDSHRSPSIPSNEQRIMISVHYYAPWDFAGEENGNITQWGPSATDPSRTSTWGQEDYMDAQLQKTYDAFVARGYPVVVGEWGSIDKSSHDSANSRYRQDFARTMVATAKQYGAATIYWDNGVNGQYGFGLFNRSSNAVTQPGIVDAIMNSSGTITNVHNGLCLDANGAATANGTQIILWTCHGSDNQRWTLQ